MALLLGRTLSRRRRHCAGRARGVGHQDCQQPFEAPSPFEAALPHPSNRRPDDMASEDETRAGSDAAPSVGPPSASVLAVRLVVGLAALLVLWQVRDVALFFFGAIVAAAILRSLAEPVV